jgi:putative ABC transport system permease protein
MRIIDYLKFAIDAMTRHRIRTVLILIAMSIGVASIIILTSLGEGAQRYVRGEFASLGTNLVIILPGRTETAGAGPTMFIGETPRDLTLQDAKAIKHNSNIKRVAPLVVGQAAISYGGKERDVPILGSTSEMLSIRHWQLAQGKFLPEADIDTASSVCVIGAKVKQELFGPKNALGEWLRIGDRRFRVIGVLASEGRSIGLDVQELAIIPAASAQMLFNTPSLFRILVEAKSRESIPAVIHFVEQAIAKRHQGERDVTVITQDAVLATFDKILGALTMTVGGIAAISLVVAGILVMNVMLVSVSQRTSEIGLLKALGSPQRQITLLFLTEAFLLSAVGALIGMLFGEAGSWIIGRIYPALPVGAPLWAFISSIVVAIGTGLLFAALPARRAAQLDPVEALAHK